MIKAVLWDNDGVLVDTEHLYFRANQLELHAAGVQLCERQYREICLRDGRPVMDLARDRGADDAAIERMRQSRNRRYEQLLGEGVSVMAGVREALAQLHRRFAMAVVTSAPPEHFALAHRESQLVHYFEFVLTPDQYERHKPHPEPYLTAAQRLGLAPHECIAVEDSERGVCAAVAAGMPVLAVPHALSCDGDFSPAARVLSGVADVPTAIEEILRARGRAA